MNFTFKKDEHLCSRKDIEALILNGNSSFIFPFKIHWKIAGNFSPPVKIAFSVPKKRFKRANKRNLIKRRTREAYRLNNHLLAETLRLKNVQINVLLVYVSSEIITFHDLEKKIKNVVDSILAEVQKIA